MRLGLIARYGNSGLGTLSWEFARHLKPAKVLLITNGAEQLFPERYSEFNVQRARQPFFMFPDEMDWLTQDVDTVLSFETFYNWRTISHARNKRVKSVLVTMAELFPEKIPIMPDLFICPSKLDMDIVPGPKTFLPIPIATDKLIWRKREKANVFIHVASHGGIDDTRKGTGFLLEAMKSVKANIKLKIYTWRDFSVDDPRIEVVAANFKNYWQLYREGDVLIHPQGANGISLPINEAMASGMGVITTDQYPFNEYFPKELLFKPSGFEKIRYSGSFREVENPTIDPKILAEKIDEVANMDISKYSLYGKKWAKQNSWDNLYEDWCRCLSV